MRRLHPLLAPHAETWAIDQLGWGFNDHAHFVANPQLRLTPQQRREHLHAFWEAHIGRPVVVVGASLGGAAAMDWALHHPEAVAKLVLIDSAGWTEPGSGDAPRALAALGVWVLRTEPLRQVGGGGCRLAKARSAGMEPAAWGARGGCLAHWHRCGCMPVRQRLATPAASWARHHGPPALFRPPRPPSLIQPAPAPPCLPCSAPMSWRMPTRRLPRGRPC